MRGHSVQTKNRILIKGYGFLCFAKNMSKNIDKKSKNVNVNIVRNFLIMPNNLQQMHLKLLQK